MLKCALLMSHLLTLVLSSCAFYVVTEHGRLLCCSVGMKRILTFLFSQLIWIVWLVPTAWPPGVSDVGSTSDGSLQESLGNLLLWLHPMPRNILAAVAHGRLP